MTAEQVPTAASSALAELLEVSPQVDAAVILQREVGTLVASAPQTASGMADRLGATCVRIIEAAEQARRELGREPIAQVEVATPDGHVFVVSDATWIVAAVTDADPTVGLVFYDLKTALRTVREARADIDDVVPAPGNGSSPVALVNGGNDEPSATSTGDDVAADERTDADASDDESPRWRRRNKR